jgi:hypothetical protein
LSKRSPRAISNAGKRVSAPVTKTSTTTMIPIAESAKNGRPVTAIPISEIATIMPENSAVRPAVSSVRAMACGGAIPADSSSR